MVEIGPVVLEKKIFKVNVFFTNSLLFPIGIEHGPSFEQTCNPLRQGCFVLTLVEMD